MNVFSFVWLHECVSRIDWKHEIECVIVFHLCYKTLVDKAEMVTEVEEVKQRCCITLLCSG